MTTSTTSASAPSVSVAVRLVLPARSRSARVPSRWHSRSRRPPPAQPELAVRLAAARRCQPWAAQAVHLAGARMG